MLRIVTLLLCFLTLSSSSAQAEKIKILMFNTWGVPITTWDRWRFKAAMKAIEELNPDVVLLSEVFTIKGKDAFKSKLYPYHADGSSWAPRLIGSGLRILSKFPIDNHAILTYGSCKKEDCLSRKGANLVTVSLPSGKKLNLVGTHLNAAGGADTRIAQLNQLQIFSDYYEDKSAPTLIAGDFNFNPLSTEYEYARKNLLVGDSWLDHHTASEPGTTYNCYENHYAHDYTLKTGGSLINDRIDYFFPRGNIQATATSVVFNDQDHLYSDHYGVVGEFEL